MKKLFLAVLYTLVSYSTIFAKTPGVLCDGLPGCTSGDSAAASGRNVTTLIGKIIAEGIKYVAVVAVLALMFAGLRYILSMGEDEKVSKAKMSIVYALIGVLLSVAAWTLISVINNFSI